MLKQSSLTIGAFLLLLNYSYAQFTVSNGGVIRGNGLRKEIAIAFTGHEYAEGGNTILETLHKEGIKASFFFTGDFYRNPDFSFLIKKIKVEKHYLGAHSDKHLLYCDWAKRDSLLLTKAEFLNDLKANYKEMERFGITKNDALYFLPPYEWYNDSISNWTVEAGLKLLNFTPGTRSNADYTTTGMTNYRSSSDIYKSITDYEGNKPDGLNGFILLLHVGAGPERQDKFYNYLPALLKELKSRGYSFVTIDKMLKNN